ncbi:MAG: AAA family ATPase [Hyphomicrobiales bacterium]
MLSVAAGAPLMEILELAYAADQPVLLHGRHGVGKSQILAETAARMGIDCVVRDLALMEAPDLAGMPRIGEDGRTHFAAPDFLPRDGAGLLVLEELNRCNRSMQAPALQLLSARRLNDYVLPSRWLPCAAVNDASDGEYTVEPLDEALAARFLEVNVVPDVTEWLGWAERHGVHERVRRFVSESPKVFDDRASNPRAWTYAARLLEQWECGERKQEALAVALVGVLKSDKWALGFLEQLANERRPLQPSAVIEAYGAHRASFRGWIRDHHLDVVAASLERLKRHLQQQSAYDRIVRTAEQRANVAAFLADLPAELRKQAFDWLEERGFAVLLKKARKAANIR